MMFMGNKRYRGIFTALLCLFWVIFFLTLPVSAETVAKVAETEGQEYTPTNKNSDTAKLFDEYVEAAADNGGIKSRIKKTAGNKLSGINKTIYTRLMGDIAQVAAGDRASTIFEIDVEDLGLDQLTWTASELGVESITKDGNLTEEATSALLEKGEYDLKAIINALLADNPYELYWYDKTSQTSSQGYKVKIFYDYNKEEYCITFTGSIAFSFPVAEEYSAGEYTFNTEIGKSVQTIVTKANAIVEQYAEVSDYEKLEGYRKEICALVSYNHNAASGSVSYGNPWQLIWVFDENPDTNVVCEGYAKAFQYLCNLTEFNEEIDCITVTGTMSGCSGDEPHMWNVVTMEDGNNYLVDITNCDEGTVGADNLLFLTGKNFGDLYNGYIFYCNTSQIKYSYDDETMNMFSNDELKITSLSYNGSGVYRSGYYNYILQNGKAVITKYSGDETEVTVPAEIDGYSVYKLGNGVFYDNSSVESIIISEGIREFTRGLVGYGGEDSDGDGMADNTGEEIRANAATIDGCPSLKRIVLPSTFTMSCSDLDTGKVLGNYIERIGPKYYNSNLDIIVSPDNPYLKVVDGILYNYDMDTLILAPHNTTQSEYTIPDGVKYIYDLAMSGNEDMVKINLPDSLEVIGFDAFGLCRNLVEVNIPKRCKIIKQSAFASTAIKKIDLPSSLKTFVPAAFANVYSLEEINVDPGNPNYYDIDGVLYSNTTNGPSLVRYPPARKGELFSVPEGVTAIEFLAFQRSNNLSKIIFPQSLLKIDTEAFFQCSELENIEFNDNLQSIGQQAFLGCPKLTEFFLPEHLDDIGARAFMPGSIIYGYPDSLAETYANKYGFIFVDLTQTSSYEGGGELNSNITWEYKNGVLHISGKGEIPILINDVPQYRENPYPWKAFLPVIKKVVVDEGITSLGSYCFSYCSNLTEATLPDSLSGIGDGTFFQCNNLKQAQIPSEITYIGRHAFDRCNKIAEITIPDTVTSIGRNAFQCCYEITQINIPDGITGIEPSTFEDCSSLQSIYVPQSVSYIGEFAFYRSGIKSVNFLDNMGIDRYAFADCYNLSSIFLGRNVYIWTLPNYTVFGNYINGIDSEREDFVIKGYSGSYMEDYANSRGIKFEAIKETGTIVQPEQDETVLKPEDIPVKSISISGMSHNIAAGKKIQLSVTVFPGNASNKMVKWSSSNPGVATVTPSGIVTVKKKTRGKSVIIRATAMDGSGKTGLWKITSMKGTVKAVVVSGKKSVKAGETLKLKANVKSTKGANKKIKWSSSNTKWATVTSSGKVKTSKAAKGKTVKITAMAMDGSKKKNTVTIKIK